MSNALFEGRHYNALAADMSDILLNSNPEHIPIMASAFCRLANAMALRSSNMQVGRFYEAAGIPRSTSPALTKRRT